MLKLTRFGNWHFYSRKELKISLQLIRSFPWSRSKCVFSGHTAKSPGHFKTWVTQCPEQTSSPPELPVQLDLPLVAVITEWKRSPTQPINSLTILVVYHRVVVWLSLVKTFLFELQEFHRIHFDYIHPPTSPPKSTPSSVPPILYPPFLKNNLSTPIGAENTPAYRASSRVGPVF